MYYRGICFSCGIFCSDRDGGGSDGGDSDGGDGNGERRCGARSVLALAHFSRYLDWFALDRARFKFDRKLERLEPIYSKVPFCATYIKQIISDCFETLLQRSGGLRPLDDLSSYINV